MLENVPLFESLSPEDRSELEVGIHTQFFTRGSVLVGQGEASNNLLYIVLSGRLKVFTSNEEGRELLLDYLVEGDTFGELSLFDDEPRSATVMTVEDCKIGLFPRAFLFTCLQNNPNIAIELLRTVIKRMRNTTEQVSSLALLDIYGRIAKVLTGMAKPQEDGRLVTDTLTHQELSTMVGSSREMVTRILNDLKRGGYVGIDNHRIEIKNRLPLRW
ncbi:MAG: Crp/Fnr family transcriptional regulator [Methylovulum miyakonense]|uniref:Crp/Fnr family transcriptional regulator n=1 Tax=Methylovulum miyakonense TaxID=645578 RepID=UPI000365BE6C|nr:Crp/Fnr family transcriptional regulator [Methylovulum miyakonense]